MFKLLVLILSATLAASAAPLFHQQAGDYDITINPYSPDPPSVPPVNYDIVFNGPAGTKHFLIYADALIYAVLGSEGILALSGSTTADEFLFAIRYTDTPQLPYHPYGAGLWLDLELDVRYPPGLIRDYGWMAIPYIRYEQLFIEMRGERYYGTPANFTYNTGWFMGSQAIPEPATVGLFALGGVAWGLRRRRSSGG